MLRIDPIEAEMQKTYVAFEQRVNFDALINFTNELKSDFRPSTEPPLLGQTIDALLSYDDSLSRYDRLFLRGLRRLLLNTNDSLRIDAHVLSLYRRIRAAVDILDDSIKHMGGTTFDLQIGSDWSTAVAYLPPGSRLVGIRLHDWCSPFILSFDYGQFKYEQLIGGSSMEVLVRDLSNYGKSIDGDYFLPKVIEVRFKAIEGTYQPIRLFAVCESTFVDDNGESKKTEV